MQFCWLNDSIYFFSIQVRLYDGDDQTEFDNGILYLTTHRLVWVEADLATRRAISLPLSYVVLLPFGDKDYLRRRMWGEQDQHSAFNLPEYPLNRCGIGTCSRSFSSRHISLFHPLFLPCLFFFFNHLLSFCSFFLVQFLNTKDLPVSGTGSGPFRRRK